MSDALGQLVRREHGRLVAALARATGGDLERAEDALQQALVIALEQWPARGWPDRPVGWLLRTARNKLIDASRRRATFARKHHLLHEEITHELDLDEEAIPDERLRLIFTCCHPVIGVNARVALTLRSVCGLSTDEIAAVYLTARASMAQRLVRAQRALRDSGVPYVVPDGPELLERLEDVLQVVYLVFTDGYRGGADQVVAVDLCEEAIRLGQLLAELVPDDGEVHGLLALMRLQHARAAARSRDGAVVLLADQDRSAWDRAAIGEGMRGLYTALALGPPGSYTLQAAIAGAHASATSWSETDWAQIVGLYELLELADPSPVVTLNRAVAVSMVDGPQAGLDLLAPLSRALARHHLFHSARADLLRRSGRIEAARQAYETALSCCSNQADRAFLTSRLADL